MFFSRIFNRRIFATAIFTFYLSSQPSLAGKLGHYEPIKDLSENQKIDTVQLESMRILGLKIMSQLDVRQQHELMGIAAQLSRAVRDKHQSTESTFLEGQVSNPMNSEMQRLLALGEHIYQNLPFDCTEEGSATEFGPTHKDLTIESGAVVDEEKGLTAHRFKASICSRSSKMIVGSCASVFTASCVLGGYLVENEWSRAILLAAGAGLLNTSGNLLGQTITLPAEWSYSSNMLAKSLLSAFLAFPANILFFSSMQIGLEPGSSVSLVALNSLVLFFCASSIAAGEIIFFDQPSNWPAWIGIGFLAATTAIQTWHAVQYPSEYRQ